MSGEAVRTILIIVLAVIGLAILWLFFSGTVSYGAFALEDIIGGVKKWFCDNFGIFCKIAKIVEILPG